MYFLLTLQSITNDKMAYKVIDLFAGVGGLSYGFAHDENFQILAANEILEPMAKAYCANHPTVKMYNMDIKDFGIANLTTDFDLHEGDIDIVVGGPPCQAYSTVGKRVLDDPRGKLFQEYFRVLKEFKPKLFVFENVKGLLSIQKGALIRQIISLFESIGYNVNMQVLNAADYGTPQIRERVIIIGTLNHRPFVYPKPTHCDASTICKKQGLKPYITLGEAIGDLPSIKSGEQGDKYISQPQNDYQHLMREHAPDKIVDHETSRNSSKLVAIMEALPDGGSPKDIPEAIRPTSGFANTYCRLWWDRPCTTITRNLGCPSSSRCIHPKDPRPLTTREGARLQGFPDDYIFCGSRAEKHLQIGNAVPTMLSTAIKDAVKEYLSACNEDDAKHHSHRDTTTFNYTFNFD